MREEDKMCLCKRRFVTIEEAKTKVENIRRTGTVPFRLFVYKCPYCGNFHLTKHYRPIDPALQDRVNSEL